jgi:hypothetical protein
VINRRDLPTTAWQFLGSLALLMWAQWWRIALFIGLTGLIIRFATFGMHVSVTDLVRWFAAY